MLYQFQIFVNSHDFLPDQNVKEVKTANAIDSCMAIYEKEYIFEEPNYDNKRWGYVGWVNGYNKERREFFRIIVFTDIANRMILYLRAPRKYWDRFDLYADTITESIMMVDLGWWLKYP